jgi:hypothetical protein
MARRVTPRFLAIACLALTLLVAQSSLAAVCDAMCASPAPSTASVAAAAGVHGGHCQAPATRGARARDGHRATPCQHAGEPSARAAEMGSSGRPGAVKGRVLLRDLTSLSGAYVVQPPFGGDHAPSSPDRARSRFTPRSARPSVLRI